MVVESIFVAVPSPKLQARLVIVPIELSVKVTVNGAMPFVGEPVNSATGVRVVMTCALVAVPLLWERSGSAGFAVAQKMWVMFPKAGAVLVRWEWGGARQR